jgi:hypothetical protein
LKNHSNFAINRNFFSDRENKKSIIIYNPISGVGHYDSWCALFARCLARKGWKICIATPNAQAISTELSELDPAFKRNILILDPHIQLPLVPKSKKLANSKQIIALKQYLTEAIDQNEFKPSPFLDRVRQAIRRRILVLLKFLTTPSLRISAHSPAIFAQDLQFINQTFHGQANLVLNMYLDLYSNTQSNWYSFNQKIENNWCAVHIDTSKTLRNINKTHLRNLKAIFYINEDLSLPNNSPLSYYWIPDVATLSLPNQDSVLTSLIKKRANNRKIVFLGGAIGETKNLSSWYQVIHCCDAKQWFFVQAGVINRATLSEYDLIALKKIEQAPPENLLIYDHYLESDAEFNQLISISDIIWGLYRDFDRSSNILGKSAVFRKPILVSDKYLMGQRVRQYKTGLAMDESDVKKIAISLEALRLTPIPEISFARYALEHGELALAEKIDQYLSKSI